jgi:cytochrome oxidase assembly protein ShyY1
LRRSLVAALSRDDRLAMRPRPWILIVVVVIVAAFCIAAGIWQLDRHEQRKARNAMIADAFRATPVTAEITKRDSVARFRRVIADGQWDYSRERVIAGRTRNGAPGVHIVTPMTLPDGSEVLVNRGWVYSPDARTVDLSRRREGDRGEIVGYVDDVPQSLRVQGSPRLYIVALADSGAGAPAGREQPARLPPPPFGDTGRHLAYVFQWFSFAAIALIGGPILVRRQRRRP